MKKVLLAMGAMLLLASCSVKTYYQVYQTKPTEETGFTTTATNVVYADKNVEVRYDFFEEQGDGGFVLMNNTDKVLYLHLDECFFVLNGEANDYFQDRSWGETTSRTTTHSFQRHEGDKSKRAKKQAEIQRDGSTTVEGTSASESKALNRHERAVVIIPPHASKRVYEYTINKQMISLCGVKETPNGSKTAGQTFTVENSPIVFANFITYTLGDSDKKHQINNTFYVSEIINAGEKAMIYEVHQKDACGKEIGGKESVVKAYNHNTPDRFFVTYTR